MANQRFTDSFLMSLKPAASPYKKRDQADFRGFGIQISTAGTKTFFLNCTIDGKSTFINLGRYTPPVRTSDATPTAEISNLVERRAYARKLRAVADSGQDPRQWIAQQDGQREKGTLSDLLDSYLSSLGYVDKATLAAMPEQKQAAAMRSMRPSATHAAQIFDKDIRTAIDESLPANAITPEMVTAALANIVRRGKMTQANRAHSYLQAAFGYGLKYNNDPNSTDDNVRFYLSTNPVSAVKRPASNESTGEVNLSTEEIKRLWHELDNYEGMSSDSVTVIKLLLITGQRVETVLGAPAREFDFESSVWDIPPARMKAKNSHVVPLHPMAASLIQSQIEKHDSEFLFPNPRDNNKPMINNSLSRAVSRFCQRQNFPKFTPRDVRRTWKSRAGEIGISKTDRDHLQAHAIGGDVSSKHYDRYDYLPEKRAAMNAWCDFLQGLVGNANVSPIRKNISVD